jgi:hypothetical protein
MVLQALPSPEKRPIGQASGLSRHAISLCGTTWRNTSMKRSMSVIAFLILLPSLILAQSVKIEALKPEFEFGGGKPSFFTTAWFVTVSVPIIGGINFVGQLPFAFGKLEDARVPTEDETIGNPGIGLRFGGERLSIEVMARAPIVKDGFAGFVGALADFDRQEAFIPDIVPIIGMIKTKINVSRFSIHPYGGATLSYKFEHGQDRFDFFRNIYKIRENDGELHVLYGAEGWLQWPVFHLGAAFNGRTWVTSGGTFSNSSIHQISVRARLQFEKVAPGALFRFPLDDRDVILLDYLFGLNFEVNL